MSNSAPAPLRAEAAVDPSPLTAAADGAGCDAAAEMAVQIVGVGESGNRFGLNDGALESILGKVPGDMPVATISVVGAFRTGKSFLLDLFLRYLRYAEAHPDGEGGAGAGDDDDDDDDDGHDGDGTGAGAGRSSRAGAADDRPMWLYGAAGSASSSHAAAASTSSSSSSLLEGGEKDGTGFKWRRGMQRMTLGIWLWNRPFILRTRQLRAMGLAPSSSSPGANAGGSAPRPRPSSKVAVLVMDTQGLFDNETGKALSVAIFGLSAVLSSYTIYNLKERIGEDSIEHIEFFTEYARLVAKAEQDSTRAAAEAGAGGGGAGGAAAAARRRKAGAAGAGAGAGASTSSSSDSPASPSWTARASAAAQRREVDRSQKLIELSTPLAAAAAAAASTSSSSADDAAALASVAAAAGAVDIPAAPFQRLEFLLRDAVLEAPLSDPAALDRSMGEYLSKVFSARQLPELRDKRVQILRCFDRLSCYMIPRPSDAVIEGMYDDGRPFVGDVNDIGPRFRTMVQRYVDVVFRENLEPKRIGDRVITGKEYAVLAREYCKLFEQGSEGAARLPVPMDAFKIMAVVNNQRAHDDALSLFTGELDDLAGPGRPYLPEEKLRDATADASDRALGAFDDAATFGFPDLIASKRAELAATLARLGGVYAATNAEREPWKSAQPVMFGIALFVALYVLRIFLDITCAPWLDVCKRASMFAGFTNSVIMLFAGYMAYQSGSVTLDKMRAFFTVASAVANAHGLPVGPGPAGALRAPVGRSRDDGAGEVVPPMGEASSAGGRAGGLHADGLRKRAT